MDEPKIKRDSLKPTSYNQFSYYFNYAMIVIMILNKLAQEDPEAYSELCQTFMMEHFCENY